MHKSHRRCETTKSYASQACSNQNFYWHAEIIHPASELVHCICITVSLYHCITAPVSLYHCITVTLYHPSNPNGKNNKILVRSTIPEAYTYLIAAKQLFTLMYGRHDFSLSLDLFLQRRCQLYRLWSIIHSVDIFRRRFISLNNF